jgi:hypothetical protein
VTLIFAARDPAHNNAVVLQRELERRHRSSTRRKQATRRAGGD